MALRDRVTELAGIDLEYLPSQCDSFLLGFAQRGGSSRPLACYGYQAAKAALWERYKDVRRLYAELQVLGNFYLDADVLWVVRYARKEMWRMIAEAGYKRWESLDRAVIGIGSVRGEVSGLVYNKSLCVDILRSDTVASVQDNARRQLDAISFIEDKVVGLDLCEYSPWFLTHVK